MKIIMRVKNTNSQNVYNFLFIDLITEIIKDYKITYTNNSS